MVGFSPAGTLTGALEYAGFAKDFEFTLFQALDVVLDQRVFDEISHSGQLVFEVVNFLVV